MMMPTLKVPIATGRATRAAINLQSQATTHMHTQQAEHPCHKLQSICDEAMCLCNVVPMSRRQAKHPCAEDAINHVSFDENDRRLIVTVEQTMGYDKSGKMIAEEVQLVEGVKAEGNIEDWLLKLEKEMQRSVRVVC